GNYVYGYPDITADNWDGGVQILDVDRIRVYEPHPFAPVLTHTAENAFEVVLADVGASLKRDPIDTRITYEARTGTATFGGAYTGDGTGIIDSQDDVGGWPELLTYDVPADKDHDGMADDWEVAHGLDTTDASDRNGDFNGDGYTNLEKYLNSLCERTNFLMAPAELTASTMSHEAIELRWRENTLNEIGFSIERSEGDTSNFVEIATTGPDDTVYTDTGLEALTTYFYRVRAYNAQVQSIPTNLAETTTLDTSGVPFQVEEPVPADGAVNVGIDTILEWDDAIGATSYDIYLGTSSPPPFRVRQSTTEYEFRNLQDATTYYWRVDAVNDSGTTTGEVWQFATESFSEALIAYWPFERGYGSLELDATGNNHFVYLNNMSATTAAVDGPVGLGLQFNGLDNYLLVRNSELINISVRGFTVTFWLELDDTAQAAPILSKGIFVEGSLNRGYEICHTGGGILQFGVGDGERVCAVETMHSSIIPDNWVMISAIRDRSDKSLKLYADTTLLASAPDSTWNISQSRDLYMAGNLPKNQYLKGALDEVRIHNYALDTTEIRTLYLEGTVSIKPQEVATLPQSLELEAYPNPFNSYITIIYTVPRTGNVQLTVYNLLGQEVGSLVDEYELPGEYTFRFNGDLFASGIYYLRLSSQDQVRIQKLMLIK
ncbi:MAG: LamG-like jellyroll fold domain-containing protein, partial [Candidatus Neomarinimicrobiota bacterium]